MQGMEGITQLLVQWSDGDKTALDELLPLVYDELRRLARSYLRRQDHNHTLQPTALVNEAYLRLINQHQVNLNGRAQFFGLAATMMRNILVDHARHRHTAKRGGSQYKVSISKADCLSADSGVDLVALDEALNELAAVMPQHSRIVELRYFGGLTIEETAEVLGISHATVERDWRFARSWLRRQLSD